MYVLCILYVYCMYHVCLLYVYCIVMYCNIILSLDQGWPTQLYYWANIFATIVKRAAKLLMANSIYFTSFPLNFFDDLFWEPHLFPICLSKANRSKNFFAISTKFASSEKLFLPKKCLPFKKWNKT